jgi:hypothetical protein
LAALVGITLPIAGDRKGKFFAWIKGADEFWMSFRGKDEWSGDERCRGGGRMILVELLNLTPNLSMTIEGGV